MLLLCPFLFENTSVAALYNSIFIAQSIFARNLDPCSEGRNDKPLSNPTHDSRGLEAQNVFNEPQAR